MVRSQSGTSDSGRVQIGRPPETTADQIAAAVLEIGFEELTFARITKHLGIAQSTLFRHVPNRDELGRV